MLRIIVISLVVGNLLLLGFRSNTSPVQPEPKPARVTVDNSNTPTIHLFSEMMKDQGLMTGNRQCFTLGPFHSVADLDNLWVRLEEVSTHISERQTEALVEKGYWVYMPPYPSLLEANEVLLSLQALGLEDIAIIYEGEWKNSISLGYFMRQENAQRRKKALEERGFKPMMRIQRQSEPRYWLDYEQEPGAGLIELDMRNRPNDFMQRPVPCPEAEFLEADAAASQGVETGPVEQPAEQAQDNAGTTEDTEPPPAESPVQAGATTIDKPDVAPVGQDSVNEASGEVESAADQAITTEDDASAKPPVVENVTKPAGESDQASVAGEEEKTADGGGEISTDDHAIDLPTAGDNTSPKPAVGTGPAHFTSGEPEPVETGAANQDAGVPDDGVPDTSTDESAEKPDDNDNGTAVTPPEGPAGQTTQEETGKDSGDGSVDG